MIEWNNGHILHYLSKWGQRMLNVIWFGMMVLAVIFGVINGKTHEVVNAVTDYAKLAFTIALGLTGIMAFWLGLMNIAEQSGLMAVIARLLKPILKRLFPDVPKDHPAMGAMVLNISANMLGLANAATPLGLKAMFELQSINRYKETASDAMCMFLAINTSSVQLVPVTAIAYLAANGASDPSSVVLSSLIATSFSTIAALTAVMCFRRLRVFRIEKEELST